MTSTVQYLSPEYVRKRLILTLVGSVIALNSIVVLFGGTNKFAFSSWTVDVCSAAALFVAILIVHRQKFDGLSGRTYTSIAIGLIFWFAAECIWSINGTRLASASRFPPIAEGFWFAGYGFFAYFLFKTMAFFQRSFTKAMMAKVAIPISAFSVIVSLTINNSSELVTKGDFIALFILIQQPILDCILTIPSIVLFSVMLRGKLASTHWLLVTTAVLVISMGDLGSSYTASSPNLNKEQWIWNMFYNAGFLCIASALIWYNTFFIFDKAKSTKIWQENNR